MSDSLRADLLVLVSVGDAVPVVLVHTALLTVVIVIIVTEGEVSRRGSRCPGASGPGPLGGPDLGLLLLLLFVEGLFFPAILRENPPTKLSDRGEELECEDVVTHESAREEGSL